ncbi:MAG TPA: biotin/lipoyl-containing protein [Terriglobales bacterium]|nr:biotin/lipoyl-containing protein [Terriglobales bacterium]
MKYQIQLGGATRNVEVAGAKNGAGGWQVALDGKPMAADVALVEGGRISLLLAGRSYTFAWATLEKNASGATLWLAGAGREASAEVLDARRLTFQERVEQSGRAKIKAPMAGKVVKLLAEAGARIEAGQGVLVLEAMKMQNEVRSPKSGALLACLVAPGDTVATGQLLAEVE